MSVLCVDSSVNKTKSLQPTSPLVRPPSAETSCEDAALITGWVFFAVLFTVVIGYFIWKWYQKKYRSPGGDTGKVFIMVALCNRADHYIFAL